MASLATPQFAELCDQRMRLGAQLAHLHAGNPTSAR